MRDTEEGLLDEIFSRKPDKDGVISLVLESDNLVEAIKKSFVSENKDQKLHSHQYRVGRKTLDDAYKAYSINFHENLENCNSFEEILQLFRLDDIKIHRFGSLAKYDIALRLALYLEGKTKKDCLPEMIYLYGNGPFQAYKNLIGKKVKARKVSLNDFKSFDKLHSLLIKKSFEAWEIEVCLCDYYKRLK